MVAINKQVARRFEAEERLLGKMYDHMKVGEKTEWMSIRKAIEVFEEPEGTISTAVIVFDDLGILGRELSYPGFQKQKVDWTLLVDRKEGLRRLAAWHEKVRMSPTYLRFPKHEPKSRASRSNGATESVEERNERPQVAVATKPASEGQELVASAGPEAESPFGVLRALRKDESKAIVAAARQYADKGAFLEKKITELRAEGFEVAPGALSIKRDERLEAVALAVPYVDALERENSRLLSQMNSGREAIRELEDLRRNYSRLQQTNERLVRERVNSGQTAAAR